MPVARDPHEADRSPGGRSSEDHEPEEKRPLAPALEGPPPRDVILLDSIPVGPGQVVDVVVPRDRSVPPPDEIIDPFEPATPLPHRNVDPAAEVMAEAESHHGPQRRRLRLSDLWHRLLRLFRDASRSG